MTLIDAYGERKYEEVQLETWGHMDATPGVEYSGKILFAASEFGGDQFILRSDFGDAGYGPWFYEGIHDWLCEQETEDGKIYEFTGTYLLAESGQHTFNGEIIEKEVV